MSADTLILDGWIETNLSRPFMYDKPEDHDYNIYEITHALSNICRFTGHSNEYYSVAQHSVLMAREAPKHLKLLFLLHDATEVYVGDMNAPLKQIFPAFKVLEKKIGKAIFKAYKLNPTQEELEQLKVMDIRMLMTEKKYLMGDLYWGGWTAEYPPLDIKIQPWSPRKARKMFLKEFDRIINTK